jgi:tetratricopeptide (TPR) repeat protein
MAGNVEGRIKDARALMDEDIDAAIRELARLAQREEGNISDRWAAEIHTELGLAYYRKSFYSLARDHFRQALATGHVRGDADMQVRIRNNLGVVNDLLGQYDAAIAHYQAALDIERDRNRPLEVAELHNNISLVYYNLGQWQDALAELDKAQELLGDSDAPFLQALIYQNQAINFHDLGRFDEYLAANRAALAVYRANQAHRQELQILYNLTEDSFRRRHDWGEARRLIEEGTRKASDNDVGIMQAYFRLQSGKLALVEDRPSAALAAFETAAERFQGLGFEPRSIPDDLYTGMIEAHARLGEADSVMKSLGRYREAVLAREMAAQRASVNELKTQLEFKEKVAQLQERTLDLERERSRSLRLMFALAIGLLVFLALLGYFRLRIRNLQRLYGVNQQSLKRHRQQLAELESAPAPITPGAEAPKTSAESAEPVSPRGQKWAYQRIERAMKEGTLYRQSGLTLPMLAEQLKLPKRLVSESINGHADATFPEYLNQYRTLHAMARLDDPGSAHMSIDQILDDAGFSSRSAFYTAFKQACGMTPAEYRSASRRQGRQTAKRSI